MHLTIFAEKLFMLKHIVLFKIPDNIQNKNKIVAILKDKLESLKFKIPQLKKLETGINISDRSSAYDVALVTEFKNESDLETYRSHPNHKDVVAYIKEIDADTIVVDYLK